ncbi:hypothetical protein EYC84_009503 [Monilinia fructicola]|uniref:Uncharacterized protein n=1 Tax=Monilinia fructicola TaxID=38448 RepID=A0A5M9JCN4_MONFR|nr:hypothetical protein EYC84_009503 [Monilinia fructicola]
MLPPHRRHLHNLRHPQILLQRPRPRPRHDHGRILGRESVCAVEALVNLPHAHHIPPPGARVRRRAHDGHVQPTTASSNPSRGFLCLNELDFGARSNPPCPPSFGKSFLRPPPTAPWFSKPSVSMAKPL